MTAYLDSSVALRYILAGDTEAVHIFSHDAALTKRLHSARTTGTLYT